MIGMISENQKKHTSRNPLQRKLIHQFHQKIFLYLQQAKVSCILDVGCGEGFGIRALKSHQTGLFFVGLDNHFPSLSWGRENIIAQDPLLCGNAIKLPLGDNAFPMVICLEVLEHLSEPGLCLQEILRVTSKFLIISVPHEPYFRLANFLRGKNIIRFGNDIDHVQCFTVQKLKKMLFPLNIEIINHSFSFPWQIVLAKKVGLGNEHENQRFNPGSE
jgi:SAM-dependent methyltransferase